MISRFHGTGATLAVAIGAALLAAPAAFAQTQPSAQSPPAQGAAPAAPNTGPAPTETELKNFAKAAVDVQNIRKSIQPQIASAKSPDARTKIEKSAEQQMEAAVRSQHLSTQRYVQIAQAVQTNPTIRDKVIKLMPPEPPATSG
ncbi:MAG: DUF4168 domain-containing protein [Rhodanobacteraceae bacterium]